MNKALILAFTGWLLVSCSFKLNPNTLTPDPVAMGLNSDKASFGELTFDSRLDRVLVPSASPSKLALIDPETHAVQLISGSPQQEASTTSDQGPRLTGVVSAVVAKNLIYMLDRGGHALSVVDPASGTILGSTPLDAEAEIVRFVPPTNELWVTQPSREQIEIFTAPNEDPFLPESTGVIPVPKGPNSLVIDRARGLAFTNQSLIGMTAVLQVQTHGMIDQWGNGCSDARGLALDENAGYLIVGCNEGKVVVMDMANNGHQLASQVYGGGINFVAYNPRLQHIYLPSGASAILAIYGIRQAPANQQTSAPAATNVPGGLSLVRLGTADTGLNSSCVTADGGDGIWVCDPENGQILYFKDTFPVSSTSP